MHGPDYAGDALPHVLTCQHCHAGAADNTFTTMEEAHAGMYVDPSAPGQSGCTECHDASFARSACDQCHAEVVTATETSLHTTQQGYITAIEARCGSCENPDQNPGFEARCAGCHTTCGQCHVSRPNSVGGGFPKPVNYSAHRFGKPDQNEQCTACHGSRIGTDYRGELDGVAADVHVGYLMDCMDCHDGAELHGDGTAYEHRYEVAGMPRCEDCHEADLQVPAGEGDCAVCHPDGFGSATVPAVYKNHAHHAIDDANCGHCHDPVPAVELPRAQCQVCHSQPYKNCTNCHNLTDEGYDGPISTIQFKIALNVDGLNDNRSEYDVVCVRHTPVDPETFANWGLTLDQYDSRPTWQYTSPHNIRKSTAQTTVETGQSCFAACHGSADGPDGFLLRESDLYEEDGTTPLVDYSANEGIVIPESFPSR